MRTSKAFGITMLVAGLVVGLAVVGVGKPGSPGSSASVTVNASFTITSWISLSVTEGSSVDFGDIAGGGGYLGDDKTELQVVSTTSWTITSSILWDHDDTDVPDGASESVIEIALGIPYSTSGGWGSSSPEISYELDLSDNDMASLPEGNYRFVIQYTATTD